MSHSLLFNGRGAIGVGPGMAGVNVKGEITLDQLAQQNPAAAQRLSEAINLGDPEMFRNVMQNDLINPDNLNSLTLRGEVSGFVSASGDLGFKLKEAGTGIEGKVSGGIEYSLPLANGEFVIDRNGLSVKGGMETGLFRVDGQGSVTYDQMLDGMQQIDPQDLYFFMNPPGL